MRRIVISGLVLSLTFIVMAISFQAVQVPFAEKILSQTAAVISAQAGSWLNHTGPSQDYQEGLVIRAVLNSPSFHYLAKRMIPAWGKVIGIKRIITTSFFFPIMVLLLFFTFYQSSRTASEGDPPFTIGRITVRSHFTLIEHYFFWTRNHHLHGNRRRRI